MININSWIDTFIIKLKETFENRVWFVGLQGSYNRGEATETSDIDVVVILDKLSPDDIHNYSVMLDTLSHREIICGFLSGREEILSWEPSDLFQFCNDTTPIMGSLDEVLALIDESAINRAIKINVCNIYHGCVHNMIHEKSEDILRSLYKSASFAVQAIAFKQTGKYTKHQKDLLFITSPNERNIIETFVQYKSNLSVDFEKASQALFLWSKDQIIKYQ